MNKKITYPFDNLEILRKYKSYKKDLSRRADLIEKKIFIASGATTDEIIKILEIFLLNNGIKPTFLTGGYGLFFEDLAFDNSDLKEFSPDVIYIHTSYKNLTSIPDIYDSKDDADDKLNHEFQKLISIWTFIENEYNCSIIQNNFELPPTRPLGNLENYHHSGLINFILKLNTKISEYASKKRNFYINDINYLSAFHGINEWSFQQDWYRSRHSVSLKYVPYLSHNISNIISAIYGKSKKALVLDLDNTLWGGVIGDDEINGIKIGHDSPVAESFFEFQKYIKELANRGVLLSIASKNDIKNALEGLNKSDGLLKESDFASIKANWLNKADNIEEIANELNIFTDAMVFIDDNPAEREAIEQFLPEVSVLKLTNNISDYINILDKSGLFESVNISNDDIKRHESFKANKERVKYEKTAKNYGEYLLSLEMKGVIQESSDDNLERVSQLINKTNQFNLTTRRYSSSEISTFIKSNDYIVIHGKLSDKFGEYGITSVMVCKILPNSIEIDTWVMSCRVFKRNLEFAMFDVLTKIAKRLKIQEIYGDFISTEKNTIVSDLYLSLGFKSLEKNIEPNKASYVINVKDYVEKNNVIEVIYDE